MNSKLIAWPKGQAADPVRLLVQTVQEISSAESMEQIIDVVTRVARLGSSADGVSFVLREGDQCFYVNEDAIGPLWKGKRFPMSACVSGWSMHHRVPAIIPDITLDARVPQEAYLPTFVRSLVMVPIRSMAPLGAIGAYWSAVQEPASEIVHWLQALADATSAGIEAVRAREEANAMARRSGAPFPNSTEAVRMCSWTRRVFHNGEWLSMEAYLRNRFGLAVTHTISEEASLRLERELNPRHMRRESY